jgi:TfoX/Sxy family transcriptional regulator of competence genes
MGVRKRAPAMKTAAPGGNDATVAAAFERIADVLRREQLADAAGPGSARRGFGSAALKTGGKIFAMVVHGALVLKLPAARVEALVAGGQGRPFDSGSGRVMKEWVALDGRERTWLELAREAAAYVGSR